MRTQRPQPVRPAPIGGSVMSGKANRPENPDEENRPALLKPRAARKEKEATRT